MAATAICKHAITLALILCAALFAIYFGVRQYYDAFWTGDRNEVNAVVLIFVPAIQGVIGLLALVGSIVDWFAYRRGVHKRAA